MTYTLSTHHYVAPDGIRYRVRIVSDDDAMSPRDADNLTVIQTFGRDITGPDEGYVKASEMIDVPSEWIDGGRVDMRRFGRYVNLFGADLGIIALAGLDIHQDWAPTLTLRLFHTDADVAEEYDGIIAITRASWDKCMGDVIPTPTLIEEVMAQDVDAYNRWASGEYVGFIVEREVTWIRSGTESATYPTVGDTMTSWEDVESLWGIDQGLDDSYALTEAMACLPDGSVETDDSSDHGAS